MAVKRMISNEVIRTDEFATMSQGAQLLYFYLNMTADDDGFNSSPKQEMIRAKASEEDMRQLINHRYIIWFESGVIVVRHWLINNKLSTSTYHSTIYEDEKLSLGTGKNGEYELLEVLPTGSKSLPLLQLEKGQVPLSKRDLINEYKRVHFKLDKPFEVESVHYELDKGYRGEEEREVKGSEEKESVVEVYEPPTPNLTHLYGEMQNVFLLPDEYEKICSTYENSNQLIDKISHYLANTERTYSSHYSLIKKIAISDRWPLKSKHEKYNPVAEDKEYDMRRENEIKEIMTSYSVDHETAEKIYKDQWEAARDKVLRKCGLVKE